MKNLQFVVGLILSSVLSQGAHAAFVHPQTEADRSVPPSGGASVVFQNAHAGQVRALPEDRFAAAAAGHTLAQVATPNVMNYGSLPDALRYQGGDGSSVQQLRTQTKLAQQGAVEKDVREPASEVLLLAGLSALAIAIRRQSPS